MKQNGIMPESIEKPKTNNNVIPAKDGIQSPDSAMRFGVFIRTVLAVTNAINLAHGFCLWIPTFVGMTESLTLIFKQKLP
jgi:hypothetical protein